MAREDKLKIFISYSRDDLKFADQLDAALDSTGFECTIDRHGIHGGEEWKLRLGNLILEVDTVVFVLSPTSAVSKICEWEVEEAARRGKRILPVLCRELEGADPPRQLKDLNYIYFYDEPKSPGSGFGAGLSALLAALNTDLDWLREHTRLLERANEWAEAGRQEATLLFGNSIAEAKLWAERRTKSAPEITPLHLEFIRASEEAEARRQDAEHQRLKVIAAAQEERASAIAERELAQKREIEASRTVVRRTMAGLIAASVLAIAATGAGIFAYIKQHEATSAAESAENNLKLAAQNSSLYRAMQANAALESDDPLTAAIVAMSGVRDLKASQEFFPEAFHALYRAWQKVKETAVLAGHAGEVKAIVPSPDGTFLVTISEDSTARLWNKAGEPKRILSGHRSALTAAAVAPNSALIVIGALDHTASVWDRDGGFKVRLSGHKAGITSVAFSPDGSTILTTSRDREARLWDLDGKTLAVLSGHNGIVTSGDFSPDGTRIVTASDDQMGALWSREGRRLATLEGHTGAVVRAIFAPGGDAIATASEDRTARLWSSTGEPLVTLQHHTAPLTSVAFSPDGNSILTGSRDNSAALWQRDGRLSSVLTGHSGAVLSVGFAPDGNHCLTTSADNTARLWNEDGTLASVMRGHDGNVTSAVFADGGGSILTASDDRTARKWRVIGNERAPLVHNAGPVVEVVFPSQGADLMTRHPSRAILWDIGGSKLAEFKNSSNAGLTAVQWSADGLKILGRFDNGEVVIWDRSGAEVARIKGPQGELASAYISPDGTSVLTLSEKTGTLWDLKGNIRATLTLEHETQKAQFTGDGSRILTVAENGNIDVWSAGGTKIASFAVDTPAEVTVVSPDGRFALRTFKGQGDNQKGSSSIVALEENSQPSWVEGEVESAAFSPDNEKLLIVLNDRSGRVIDITGSVRAVVHQALKLDKALGFSADGRRVLAMASGGSAVALDHKGRPILSFEKVDGAAMSTGGSVVVTVASGAARVWPAYPDPQVFVDYLRATLPRCLGTTSSNELYLEGKDLDWCETKYPKDSGQAVKLDVSGAPRDSTMAGPEVDFAYYPPGDLPHPELGAGRRGDRKVYLKDIAFPLKLGPGEHAYMNSGIWGYGGGGWNGKGAAGSYECDPRNYDSMRQRDTYCEVRGWAMPLCPSGKGKQGQAIRPPSCKADRWEVVAVIDGVIANVTSNTTVQLKGVDGTDYFYLHMMPQSIRVKPGDRVQKGDVIGKVGNYMGSIPATTIHLTFNARKRINIDGRELQVWVPPYTSLIAAYRELKGLDRGIDVDGNLIVDPNFEIGAGKIPRPPE